MSAPRLRLRRLAHGEDLELPAYGSEGAAGLDLRAAVPVEAPVTILPGARAAVPTGLEMEIAAGFEGQVRPRSGLARRSGLTVLNAPGTIDADYRGEVVVLLVNLGSEPVELRRGDRIAQLVIAPVVRVEIEEVGETSATRRGAGGFGSTGTA